jgi:hypothetical protein
LPNGSTVTLSGADDERDIEKLRGPSYDLVIVDEAGSFADRLVRYMAEEILEPALLDRDGSLWLIGTPNAECRGYFHDACLGRIPGWSSHHWTMMDNTHIPHAGAWLERKKRAKGWADDNVILRREYLGEWVRDETSMVYRVTASNIIEDAPTIKDAKYVLGVDIGTAQMSKDETKGSTVALSLWMFGKATVQAYCIKSWRMPCPEDGVGVSDVAKEIERTNKQTPLTSCVVDAGGLGGAFVTEFRRRYLPVKPAEKTGKSAFIELLNDDLRMRKLCIVGPSNQAYLDEISRLQWDQDAAVQKEDTRTPNHLCDAGLYAWRECRHYHGVQDEPGPALTAEQIAQAEADKMRDELIARQRRLARMRA